MPSSDAVLAKSPIGQTPITNAQLAGLTQVKYETPTESIYTRFGGVTRNVTLTHPHVAVISLNRAKYANTISRIMTNELDIAFTAANQDPEVRVIVLRGEGKHFSSGHDLGTPEQNADPNWAALSSNGFRGEFEKWSTLDAEYCLRWRSLGKPVIAALKGYVIYHACSLASVADIIIAADDLKYMPTMVQCFMLPWDLALNARKVKEILLTRRFILAPEAEELGLVNRIVPTGQEDAEALRMAALISNVSDGFQARMIKLGVNQAQDIAGLTAHVRGNTAVYGAYSASRDDPGALFNFKKLVEEKQLAPIKKAMEEETFYWTRTASRADVGKRGKGSKL